MFNYSNFINKIFEIKDNKDFIDLSLLAFDYQYHNNNIYKTYCELLKKSPKTINNISEIPFLPISFFKSNKILISGKKTDTIFSSSTTSGNIPSLHYVHDLNIYKKSFLYNFKKFYSETENYVILALLPSYLEREGSSLVFMIEELIKISNKKESGFFLYQYADLYELIKQLENNSQKYLLFGVSFALLDFATKYSIKLKHGIIMETGGMKGRKTEITRSELHKILKNSFGQENIHSEYGMTELLSQAYSQSNGIFSCPEQMKVFVRDPYDALSVQESGKGALNIIDLANINSCCFIETDDLGKVYENGKFEISGRFDSSEIRGCSLMV